MGKMGSKSNSRTTVVLFPCCSSMTREAIQKKPAGHIPLVVYFVPATAGYGGTLFLIRCMNRVPMV